MRERVLRAVAAFVLRRPRAILIVSVLLAAASAIWASVSLRLNANTDDLIARDRPYMQDYLRFLDEFGDLEALYVVVDPMGEPATAERCVEWLVSELRSLEGLPEVHGYLDVDEQLRIATRAMPEDDLEGLVDARASIDLLTSVAGAGGGTSDGSGFGATDAVDVVLGQAESLLGALLSGGRERPREEQERLGARALLLLESALPPANVAHDDAGDAGLAALKREYLRSEGGSLYFVEIMPAKDYGTLAVIEGPLRAIRSVLERARVEFPAVEMGLTGKPVLQADEMATSNEDMTRAAIFAFSVCALLFVFVIGGIRRPLLAVAAFLCGLGWTYGYATLVVGQLNLLSLVFTIVLVGVGMDYGVHVLLRYREARRTRSLDDALVHALVTAVRGNLTGALTSFIVFFMAVFTSFQGLRELGLIASGGLVLCLLAMTLVLPALLVLTERETKDQESAPTTEESVWWVRRPGMVLLGVVVVTVALWMAPGSAYFEQNLLELQATDLDSVRWEHRVLDDDSESTSWSGFVVADDFAQLETLVALAREQPKVGAVHSLLDLMPAESPRRAELRSQLHGSSDGAGDELAQPAGDGGNESPTPIADAEPWSAERSMALARQITVLAAGAAAEGDTEATTIAAIAARAQRLAEQWQGSSQEARAGVAERLAFAAHLYTTMRNGDRTPLRAALPAALRDRLMSPAGRYLISVFPSEDVWEFDAMQAFVDDLRVVQPDATGVPITHFESLKEMRAAFVRMAFLALAAVAVLLVVDFRSWREPLLALAPLALGMFWTVQVMGFAGISFNLANFFAVPILIGLSVDSGIHILHRYREGGPERFTLGATRRAVALTAFTTIIGFGSLCTGQHRGLVSLGSVMAIGSTACVLASIVLLPSILIHWERFFGARE